MPTIEVSDETFAKLQKQFASEKQVVDLNSLNDLVGQQWFFRTVTYHLVGKVKKVFGRIIELEDAAWVADSGRFADALSKGTLNEVEPVGRALLNFDTVTDCFPWKHKLPLAQK